MQAQNLLQEGTLRLITKKVPANFNLFLFGDCHMGSILFHQDGWNQLVDMIHSPYKGLPASANYGVDMGDMVDAIMIDDPRFDFSIHQRPFYDIMVDEAVNARKPIVKKLITILIGNHEWKLLRFSNLTEKVCKVLNVPYGTWSSRITFKYKRNDDLIFKAFVMHGSRNIRSRAKSPELREANEKDMLRDALKYKAGACSLAAMGHSHRLIVAEPIPELHLDDDEQRITQIYTELDQQAKIIPHYDRWYVNTGSFLKLYGNREQLEQGITGYAERFGYDPIELGFTVCRVRDKKIEGVDKIKL